MSRSSLVTQIASKDVGKLIGRGGATINELRQKSGCRIDINRDNNRNDISVDVTLTGQSQDAVEKCQYSNTFNISKVF